MESGHTKVEEEGQTRCGARRGEKAGRCTFQGSVGFLWSERLLTTVERPIQTTFPTPPPSPSLAHKHTDQPFRAGAWGVLHASASRALRPRHAVSSHLLDLTYLAGHLRQPESREATNRVSVVRLVELLELLSHV
eukprot:971732-Pleurochrysis_carterae.AAC.1